jgi:hypothetical protein
MPVTHSRSSADLGRRFVDPAVCRILQICLMLGALLAAAFWVPPVRAQLVTVPGPDGTPQFDRAIERRTYLAAGSDEVLTYGLLVQQEASILPVDATPDQMKSSNLRKRLLDLRLMLDFNAYLYDPDQLEPIREKVDAAYETVGLYKDLYDQSQLTGDPIDPDEQAKRASAMNDSLGWLRDAAERRAMAESLGRPGQKILDFTNKETPRLWRIADITPVAGQSSLATVALLCANALTNLEHDGLLVDDILDPEQEAQFHDVRKALRSILVLVDMFPTGADVVGEQREALASLVDAYGEVNDASIAYHDAEAAGHGEDDRRDDLQKAYKKAQRLVKDLDDGGQLRQYVAKLTPLQLFDVDPFH